MANEMIVVYGGVDCGKKMGIRPALTITKAKHLKLAKKTAKDREFNCVVVEDAALLKKLAKMEVKDGFQNKGENGFLMVPFCSADKLVTVYRLLKNETAAVKNNLTIKAFKTAKAKLEA